jgi:hypothetical protein
MWQVLLQKTVKEPQRMLTRPERVYVGRLQMLTTWIQGKHMSRGLVSYAQRLYTQKTMLTPYSKYSSRGCGLFYLPIG